MAYRETKTVMGRVLVDGLIGVMGGMSLAMVMLRECQTVIILYLVRTMESQAMVMLRECRTVIPRF